MRGESSGEPNGWPSSPGALLEFVEKVSQTKHRYLACHTSQLRVSGNRQPIRQSVGKVTIARASEWPTSNRSLPNIFRLTLRPPYAVSARRCCRFWRPLANQMTHHQVSDQAVVDHPLREPSALGLNRQGVARRADLGAYRHDQALRAALTGRSPCLSFA